MLRTNRGTIERGVLVALLALAMNSLARAGASKAATHANSVKEFRGPLSYKDKASETLFYVESDGRHVAALDTAGKILWVRDPFVEAKLKPYRFKQPKIAFIGAPLEWMVKKRNGGFLAVTFNSTQFGIMSFKTGEFEFLGQD